MRHVGLHIGGGPNDEAGRRPFLRAIESRHRQFLHCYRYVREPLRGGTFGADLFVARGGGAPEVRRTRQRLGPGEFESCMVDAFNSVRFAAPGKPTSLSYSLRFDVTEPSAP